MKTVYKMLLGALLGFLGAYCLLAAEFEMTLLDVAFEATLVISGLTILLIIYCFSGISRMKKECLFRSLEMRRMNWKQNNIGPLLI